MVGSSRTLTQARVGDPLLERKRLSELQKRLFGIAPPDVRVSRYIVESLAGEGAFGSVYRGYDPDLRRPVAIKVLRGESVQTEASTRGPSQLLVEAQALARFTHPNVVAVYDVGVLEDALTGHEGFDVHPGVYLVMEYVDGPTLRDWLVIQARAVTLILDTFVEAGRGLAAAHARGILHRDFKPHNVLVGRDGRVCVADFGLACDLGQTRESTDDEHEEDARDAASSEATHPDRLVGTPAYMAPEQQKGEEVDARADQFAYCVSLFEALYGARPFRARDFKSLYRSKMAAAIEGERPAHVPVAIDRIVRRGLHPHPQERFESMEALLDALEEARRAPANRRLFAGAASAAVALVVSVAALASNVSRDEACEARDAAVLAAWDEESQEATREAFHQTGLHFADDAYERLRMRVDHYIEMLAIEREAACAADAGTEDGAREQRERARCLDARALRLAETLRVFREADAAVVERAVERIGSLEPPAWCADANTRAALARRRASERFAPRFERMRASLRAGHHHGARVLVESIVDDARADNDRETEALALLWHGRVLRELREAERAALVLEDALSVGAAIESDELVAQASAELAAVEGALLSNEARARELLARSSRLLAQLQSPDESAYRLAVIEATLAREAGQPEAALEHFREARRIAAQARADQPSGPWVSRARTTAANLADTHTILGQYTQALALLGPVLASLEEELGPWHPRVGRLQQSLAFVYVRMEEHGKALIHARRALEIEQRRGGHSVAVAWALNLVGGCQIEVGLPAQAVDSHARSVAMLTDLQGERDVLTLRARMNLARARMEAGDLEGARSDVAAALRGLTEVLGPDHLDLSYAYVTQGEIAVAAGDPEGARKAFEEARRLRNKALGEGHPQVVLIEEKLDALPDTVE